jgi:hypothetical protein
MPSGINRNRSPHVIPQWHFMYPNGETCRPIAPRERVANPVIIYSGAAAIGAGVGMVWNGLSRQKQAAVSLQDLDKIRTEQHWSLSFDRLSAQLAYRW